MEFHSPVSVATLMMHFVHNSAQHFLWGCILLRGVIVHDRVERVLGVENCVRETCGLNLKLAVSYFEKLKKIRCCGCVGVPMVSAVFTS